MDEKEFLQEFIDFIKGVEEIEFCHESNDPESDQQFNRTCKTDRELISSFRFSRQPKEKVKMTCPICGGKILGDGYTTVLHCENADPALDVEPDAAVIYCEEKANV